MTDEVQALAEVAPVTEPVGTAPTETVVENTPEEKPAEVPKTFTQEELDAAIGKRLAREQRKWEREHAQRQAETQVLKAPVEIPPLDQFQSPEAYAEALALKKAQELVSALDPMWLTTLVQTPRRQIASPGYRHSCRRVKLGRLRLSYPRLPRSRNHRMPRLRLRRSLPVA